MLLMIYCVHLYFAFTNLFASCEWETRSFYLDAGAQCVCVCVSVDEKDDSRSVNVLEFMLGVYFPVASRIFTNLQVLKESYWM